MVVPAQVREALAQQAEELDLGLSAFAAMTKDAGSLLARMDKHLAKLNKANGPIFEQAAKLTWAEQNIVAAKAATDQLLVHMGTARKVRRALRLRRCGSRGRKHLHTEAPAGQGTLPWPTSAVRTPAPCHPPLTRAQVEPALRGGPGRDLTGYMALLTQLEGAMAALEASYTLPVAQEAYQYAAKVRRSRSQCMCTPIDQALVAASVGRTGPGSRMPAGAPAQRHAWRPFPAAP